LDAGGEATFPDGLAQRGLEGACPWRASIDRQVERGGQIGLENRVGIGLSQRAAASLAWTVLAVGMATRRAGADWLICSVSIAKPLRGGQKGVDRSRRELHGLPRP